MANSDLCSVEGCGKPRHSKGFCPSHYERWKLHGDPSAGRTPKGSLINFVENIARPYSGDACLPWPYSRTGQGYGKLKIGNGYIVASRYVCIRAHGEPPTPQHQAAHSCGNGRLGCVNPRHLSWKTPIENDADKMRHGTINRGERNPAAKLTESQVREIRSLAGHLTRAQISEMYGICPMAISRINARKSWASITEE
jgi:hypothetical protein